VGEGIDGGTVVALLVGVGDRVEVDQPVLELETDKAVIEVPSSLAGLVEDVHVEVNQEARVGQVILTLAADGASVAHGALLLLFYAAGLGIPFLVTGAALGSSAALLRKLGPHMALISIASGVLIVFMGMLILLDNVRVLNDSFTFVPTTAEEAGGSIGGITGVFGFGVAFLAGFLSFLSPCVLPLVPIYIGHLAGVGAQEVMQAPPGDAA
jgi:pyruvate/2-oxoglutarate dehydrogenase complex dihydrolipoamide acyltransferase (E2) component